MIYAIRIETIAGAVPQLARGRVWCRQCGFTMTVDSAECMRIGWPKCHGETMTIDSPEERERLAAARVAEGDKP
jgi:Zn finger protein HypA/HybF involved in hydrogenase expression